MTLKSKSGWILVGVYGIFLLYCFYHVFFVPDHWAYAIRPALPWFFIFRIGDATSNVLAYGGVAVSMLVNIVLLYFIGAGLGKLFRKNR